MASRDELLDEIDEELSYLSNNELNEVLQAIIKIQRSSRYQRAVKPKIVIIRE